MKVETYGLISKKTFLRPELMNKIVLSKKRARKNHLGKITIHLRNTHRKVILKATVRKKKIEELVPGST